MNETHKINLVILVSIVVFFVYLFAYEKDPYKIESCGNGFVYIFDTRSEKLYYGTPWDIGYVGRLKNNKNSDKASKQTGTELNLRRLPDIPDDTVPEKTDSKPEDIFDRLEKSE